MSCWCECIRNVPTSLMKNVGYILVCHVLLIGYIFPTFSMTLEYPYFEMFDFVCLSTKWDLMIWSCRRDISISKLATEDDHFKDKSCIGWVYVIYTEHPWWIRPIKHSLFWETEMIFRGFEPFPRLVICLVLNIFLFQPTLHQVVLNKAYNHFLVYLAIHFITPYRKLSIWSSAISK